ncbi:MAG: hypothetical protein ABI304_02105 [Rudaea sp.]
MTALLTFLYSRSQVCDPAKKSRAVAIAGFGLPRAGSSGEILTFFSNLATYSLSRFLQFRVLGILIGKNFLQALPTQLQYKARREEARAHKDTNDVKKLVSRLGEPANPNIQRLEHVQALGMALLSPTDTALVWRAWRYLRTIALNRQRVS